MQHDSTEYYLNSFIAYNYPAVPFRITELHEITAKTKNVS